MRLTILFLAILLGSITAEKAFNVTTQKAADIADDPNDWPSYNRDGLGTRFNPGEKALSKDNVAQLEEKWRFPPADSKDKVGVVHATVVVNGYVYFGTGKPSTFYKLTPDGKVKWAFKGKERPFTPWSLGLPRDGFINAGLLTKDAVYACDLGGMIYALDRAAGKELWSIDTRAAPCPTPHSSNCIFAAPILADGNVVVAGGGFEHGVALNPLNTCCSGRGFVMAVEPRKGKVVWKYEVGPEPQKLDPPVKIKDSWGEHVFRFGPSTSSVWCTPSYDPDTHTIFFGTDTHNAPRQPTKDDPKLYTKHSCALIAIDSRTGAEKWVTQINPGDVWNYSMRGYDPDTQLYKDQSIGDTPKIYWILWNGRWRKVIGFGCKNGGFYVLDAATGEILFHTPVYDGPPVHPPPSPANEPPTRLDPRTLALPGAMGGLQTGCATDGKAVFTNGTDIIRLGTNPEPGLRFFPPTGGRVVSISLDTRQENWRHERPKVKIPESKGKKEKPAFTEVGDPVASGIAVANSVVYFTTTISNKLVALDASTGQVLKEIDLGPVWCGPTVSRGRVYVGTGNDLLSDDDPFPKSSSGGVRCFGLPGEDEVSRMKSGNE